MADDIPSLPPYPPGVPTVTRSEQKPMIRILNQMLTKRLRLPRGKTQSQNVKIKEKKVKYW